jgi:gliding motility-associated-like protein
LESSALMKKLLVFILTSTLFLGSGSAQCPFTASQTIFNDASCIKAVHIFSSSEIDQAAIYKDNVLIDTFRFVFHGSGLVLGGNGPGNALNQLNNPEGVFIDTTLSVYVSDAGNNRVMKFGNNMTTGVVVAGGNGLGAASNQLNNPAGIYVDVDANIYVVDRGNNRIQKWAPGATAGSTVAGGNGAGAASNQLDNPLGIFVDKNGNIYITDENNNRVQEWLSGAVTGITVAGGNGAGAAANQLNGPVGITVDGAGNLFIVDKNNNRVQKWAPPGLSGTTVAGGNGPGAGANQLDAPNAIFMDAAGDIYISDFNNNRIQEWTPGNTRGITVAGGNLPNYSGSPFTNPTGVFVNVFTGITVTLDGAAQSVQRWNRKLAPDIPDNYDPEQSGNGSYTALITDIYGCKVLTNAVQITDYVVPSIQISTNTTTISSCSQTVFTATSSYAGNSPVYQWVVNSIPTGTNDSVFTISGIQDGDVVSCILTSSDPCTLPNPAVTSNLIQMHVPVANAPTIQISASANNVCEGTRVEFTATVTNESNAPVFQWQIDNVNEATDEAIFSIANLKNGDLVSCSISNGAGCIMATSNTIGMLVLTSPVVSPNQSFTYSPGKSLTLNPLVSGDIVEYLWTPDTGLSDNSIANPNASPSKTTNYKLTVTASNGCQSAGDILVKVFTKISMANAFTPNGDGKNDVFYVMGGLAGALVKDFSVFDRWGEKLFEVSDVVPGDPAFGWNGRFKGADVAYGTYVYIVTIQLADKSTQTIKGSVVLIR